MSKKVKHPVGTRSDGAGGRVKRALTRRAAGTHKGTVRLLRGRKRSEMSSPLYLGLVSQAESNPNQAVSDKRRNKSAR